MKVSSINYSQPKCSFGAIITPLKQDSLLYGTFRKLAAEKTPPDPIYSIVTDSAGNLFGVIKTGRALDVEKMALDKLHVEMPDARLIPDKETTEFTTII